MLPIHYQWLDVHSHYDQLSSPILWPPLNEPLLDAYRIAYRVPLSTFTPAAAAAMNKTPPPLVASTAKMNCITALRRPTPEPNRRRSPCSDK